jgi:predicted Rossmann fold nucleotide-binding protein DprA/Smf involved in DNA uptake
LIREGAKLVERVEDILVELELPAKCLHSTRTDAVEQIHTNDQPQSAGVEPATSKSGSGDPEPVPEPAPKRAPAPQAPSDMEQSILAALSPDGSYVDEIATSCRLSVSEALSSLTMLELKGLVRQFSGKRFAPR